MCVCWYHEHLCLSTLTCCHPQGCSMFTSVKAFEGQQYSTLKRQCLQSGLLFEDPRFPAIDDSLFCQGNRIGRVVWKRPRVSGLVKGGCWSCWSFWRILKTVFLGFFFCLFSIKRTSWVFKKNKVFFKLKKLITSVFYTKGRVWVFDCVFMSHNINCGAS